MAKALQKNGIRAVLTGGACATIYSGGDYQSEDLDFILRAAPSRRALDAAMASASFHRRIDHYEHPHSRFFVEFPRGPLAIGEDIAIRPVDLPVGGVRVVLLSPTDSCRDPLAAFYHWKDRQSLEAAISIALRHRVRLDRIRSWSAKEGASQVFDGFLDALQAARMDIRRARRVARRRSRKPRPQR